VIKPSLNHLRSATIVGQLDKKFIMIASPHNGETLLSAIDQHAADERIRKCAILAKIFDEATASFVFAAPPEAAGAGRDSNLAYKLTSAAPTFRHYECTASLTPEELESLGSLASALAEYGWSYKLTESTLTLTAYPVICHVHQTIAALQSFLLKPNRCPFRRSIDRHSCRHAIFFNVSLSRELMRDIVVALAGTANWSICAHGRPTVVPLRLV
jgi:DNA mismatch repair ATPase MutL